MTFENVSEAVAQAYDDAVYAYDTARENDRAWTARNAGNAKSVTFSKGFNNSDFEHEANGAVYAARDRALSSIEKALDAREAQLTKPPSAEAVAYITAISARDNLTADELQAAMDKYGSNHTAAKAILGAAKRSGHMVDDVTEVERDIAGLRNLAANTERAFSPFSISDGNSWTRWAAKQSFRG